MKPNISLSGQLLLRQSGLLAGSLLASPLLGYGYARYVETRLLRIARHTLPLPKLPRSFHGKRIVQFSDVHLDFHFGLDRLARLVDTIRSLRPDMLVFTGDLYHARVGGTGEACARQLRRLQPPLGKWAVLGNHDYTAGAGRVASVLAKGGFHVLDNRSETVDCEGERIRVAGIDDMLHGSPDMKGALARSAGDKDRFTLLLAHEPDVADDAALHSVDLQLSGHSHGGQVRLPFYGPLFTPEGARNYPAGLYRIGNGKLFLYTNSGIGVSAYPVRFCCRPELTVITLACGA